MAGLSLYNIPDWAVNTNYSINDIYKYGNYYYYAIVNHNSGTTFNSDYSDGVTTFNNRTKPSFFWRPSYNTTLQAKPDINEVKMGDGYRQITKTNINALLLPFSVTFDKRDDNEARAILHFFTQNVGTSFCWTPPFPYNKIKLFLCPNWDYTTVFINHHIVRAEFSEVVV